MPGSSVNLHQVPDTFEVTYRPRYVNSNNVFRILFVKTPVNGTDGLAGVLVNEKGHQVAAGVILITDTGEMFGGKAISYITRGGKDGTESTYALYRQEFNNLRSAILHTLPILRDTVCNNTDEGLVALVTATLRYDVTLVDDIVSQDDDIVLTQLGVPEWLAVTLVLHNKKLVVDPHVVGRAYAWSRSITIVEGLWGAEAAGLAGVNNVPTGICQFLRAHGYAYARAVKMTG